MINVALQVQYIFMNKVERRRLEVIKSQHLNLLELSPTPHTIFFSCVSTMFISSINKRTTGTTTFTNINNNNIRRKCPSNSFIKIIFSLMITSSFYVVLLESSSFVSDFDDFNKCATYSLLLDDDNRRLDSFIFYSIGDWGVRGFAAIDGGHNFPGSAQMAVAKQMRCLARDYRPEFIGTLGDNFYGSGVKSVDDVQWQYKWNDVYLHSSNNNSNGNSNSLQRIKWFAALGDHDHCGNVQAQIDYHNKKNYLWHLGHGHMPFYHKEFSLLSSSNHNDDEENNKHSSSHEMWQLIVIDWVGLEGALAGGEKRRFSEQLGTFASPEAGNEQLRWLQRVLEQGHGKYKWRVITAHRPIISASARFENDNNAYPGESATREALRLIIENSDVDVYINGHDHTAQHACTERDDYGGKNKLTHYITNGIGGYELHQLVPNERRPVETIEAKNTFHGFAMHSVTKDRFQTVFIGHDGTVELELSFDKNQQKCKKQ
jgi:tartrate-resistant acid phosphatase type 5